MDVTFYPTKDVINSEKHGVPLIDVAGFVDVAGFEWDEAVTWPDQRHECGEHREMGLGYTGDRLYNAVCLLTIAKSAASSACGRLT
jgi:hypothetical protein